MSDLPAKADELDTLRLYKAKYKQDALVHAAKEAAALANAACKDVDDVVAALGEKYHFDPANGEGVTESGDIVRKPHGD